MGLIPYSCGGCSAKMPNWFGKNVDACGSVWSGGVGMSDRGLPFAAAPKIRALFLCSPVLAIHEISRSARQAAHAEARLKANATMAEPAA